MATKSPFVRASHKMSPPLSGTSSRKSKFKLKEAVSSSADMLIATACKCNFLGFWHIFFKDMVKIVK